MNEFTASRRSLILLGCGLAFLVWLLHWQGVSDVIEAVMLVGWNLIWLAIYRFVPLTFDAIGWSALFPKHERPGLLLLLWTRWIAESVNTLLPVAQVGGHVVRANLLRRRWQNSLWSAASVTVDFTMGLTAQILFTLTGLGLFFMVSETTSNATGFILAVGFGSLLIFGFYLAQRKGLFSLAVKLFRLRTKKNRNQSLVSMASILDNKISELYEEYQKVTFCLTCRLLSWFSKTGETWLFLCFSNHEAGLTKALIIESLGGVFRSAAFAVPGAVGVQEGGLFLVGTLLGLAPETALGLALAKRAREILVGLPGLASWSFTMSRRPHGER